MEQFTELEIKKSLEFRYFLNGIEVTEAEFERRTR